MKKNLIALAIFALGFNAVYADETSTTIPVTGSFTTACNITTSSITLGEVDLNAKVVAESGTPGFVSIPVSVAVSCNYDRAPWTVHAGTASVATIGGVVTNTACLGNATTGKCGLVDGPLTGVGTDSVAGGLIIRSTGTTKPWDGAGAISTTLNATVVF